LPFRTFVDEERIRFVHEFKNIVLDDLLNGKFDLKDVQTGKLDS
jgi:hypothetical protein